MRLIDADKLDYYVIVNPEDVNISFRFLTEYGIKYAPTIDAVEVVRCKDCKYWVYNFKGCSRNPCTEPWYATDFCSYGERKESNG